MISASPLHPVFAAQISGLDLTRPLDAADVAAIEAALDRHAVLVLPGQAIDDAQQVAFSRRFGALEPIEGGHIARPEERRLGSTPLADLSNLDQHNRKLARDDRRRMFNLGNRLWHSDSSFRAIPAKYSMLSGRVVPPSGGNTEFADMRDAYDTLPESLRAEIEDLIAEHSLLYSRGQLGFTEFTAAEREMFRPVRQRLVRTHPVTGRKSLFLSAHIVGMPVPEALDLLRELTEHATQRSRVYVHVWRQHDLVIWDNRQTMHRARRFDEAGQVRDMRRSTIAGTALTVAQAA